VSERVSERESGAMALMAASDATIEAANARRAKQSKATTTPGTLNCSWQLDRNTIIGTIH
jgi:hypothetical protein